MAEEQQLAEVVGAPFDFENARDGYLADACEAHPQNLALVSAHQPAKHLFHLTGSSGTPSDTAPCLEWTHSQLRHAALSLSAGLQAAGVESTSTIITFLPNCVEWNMLLYASVDMPFAFAPLDPGALQPLRREELCAFFARLKPNVVVVSGPADAAAIDDALGDVAIRRPVKILLHAVDGEQRLTGQDNAPPGWGLFAELAERHCSAISSDVSPSRKSYSLDDTSSTLFTSGTSSGRPKGCPRSFRQCLYTVSTISTIFRLDSTTRFLQATANFRVINAVLIPASWRAGGAAVIPGATLTPESALRAIEQFAVTNLILVPALMYMLSGAPSFKTTDVRSIKSIALCGDIIVTEMMQSAREAFPSADVFISHGMTEGAGGFQWPFHGRSPADLPHFGGICPLGKVIPGTTVKVVNLENNAQTLRRSEPGELWLLSPGAITHYLDNEHADAFHDDERQRRWIKTGDLGMIDPDGHVFILGRIKDRIKRAGVPIMPAALESSLTTFTGSQVTVIGLPDPILGHVPFAIFRALATKTAPEVTAHVTALFGKDYALAGVLTLADLGRVEFPQNATQKILKSTLVDEVQAYFASRARTNGSS